MTDLADSIRGAEDAIEQAIWKLKALADIFSVLSSADNECLRSDSFYGVSQIMRDEIDRVEKQMEVISTCRLSIGG
jgi:hypothetical protein